MGNKKNIKKFIFSISMLITFILISFENVYAATLPADVADRFGGNDLGSSMPKSIVTMILSPLRIAAIGAAVIAVTILGIRYMAGAPNEKAEIKDQIITLVLGIVFVVSATEIAGELKRIAGTIKAG